MISVTEPGTWKWIKGAVRRHKENKVICKTDLHESAWCLSVQQEVGMPGNTRGSSISSAGTPKCTVTSVPLALTHGTDFVSSVCGPVSVLNDTWESLEQFLWSQEDCCGLMPKAANWLVILNGENTATTSDCAVTLPCHMDHSGFFFGHFSRAQSTC